MAEHTGKLTGYSSSNGWTTIELEGAPKGISTKKKDIVDKIRELEGQMVTASWSESDAKDRDGNPKINDNTGRPYVNRWLNEVLPAANVQAQDPAPAVTPAAPDHAAAASPATAGPGYSKDVSIVRQVAWKAAAQLFSGTGNFTQALAAAAAIETHILRQSEPGFGEGPQDDGIPFDRTAA